MTRAVMAVIAVLFVVLQLLLGSTPALACPYVQQCPDTELDAGSATVSLTTAQAGEFAGSGVSLSDYQWQLRSLCEISNQVDATCSPSDFRPCPEEPGRIFEFLV